MRRRLSVEADLSIRTPSGTGRVTGSGGRVEVAVGWRLLLAVLLDARLRKGSASAWRFLEERGVGVRLRLPGLPGLDLDRLAFGVSFGLASTLSLAAPFLLT